MSAITRILLRYVAMYFMTKGLLSQDMADALAGDPEVAALVDFAIGAIIAGATEGWYLLAKRMGWRT